MSRHSSGVRTETVGLLEDQDDAFDEDDEDYISTVYRLDDGTRSRIPRFARRFAKRVAEATSWMNPVIIGAILAVLFGVCLP